jgi:rhamnose transport system permease protein
VLGIPVLPLITVAVMLVAGFFMRSYRAGRELYAIGSNPDAAVLAGIRVSRRVFAAFLASGALAGLAGVLWTARFGTVDATAAQGIELEVVAAVVVGGVAIFGGSGTVYGAALGALLLASIGSALGVLNVSSFWEQAIDGALLLAAIALDRLLVLRLSAALQRRSVQRAA